ncbi:MAG: hypothetical protein ACOC1F_07920 [Myxococcota bacterium]
MKLPTLSNLCIVLGLASTWCCGGDGQSQSGPTTPAVGGGAGRGGSAAGGSSTGGDSTGGTGATSGSGGGIQPTGGFVVDHRSANAFDQIPAEYIDKAKSDLRIFYGHLSHGDQIMNGLDMLGSVNPSWGYGEPFMMEFYGSLDPRPDTPQWEQGTREQLSKPGNDRNVVMFAWSSWLGRPERVDADHVDNVYLARMEALEADYPNVRFVYFTGPAQTWEDPQRAMPARNKQIRDYALANDNILFDFEAIELYDPDGSYHENGTDACEWCSSWCSNHDCAPVVPPTCSACSEQCSNCETNHSHCYSCYRKGQAFWYLAARLAGWPG